MRKTETMIATPTAQLRVCRRRAKSRRGAAAVFGLVLTTALVILMAVSIDMGYIGVARSEIKRSADAAAIAGCWELFDSRVEGLPTGVLESEVSDAAAAFAAVNKIHNQSPHVSIANHSVELGHFDLANPGVFDTADPTSFNAVRIRLRRQAGSNGEIPLFFGGLTGRHQQALQVTATAAMLRTISGFRMPTEAESLPILPFALDLETWERVLAEETEDTYSFDAGEIARGADGYFECNLFPQGTGSPGNRGTVDIGHSNNSTADIARQIVHGISADDYAELDKPLELDEAGELTLNGDTGISAGMKDELASIVGQKRIIPIFTHVTGNGNNAMFTIVRFEGVRVLDVKLTGPMYKKHLTVQPVPMVARHSIVNGSQLTSSSYLYAPVMLVE